MVAGFYLAPESKIRQGDIVALAPHLRALKPPVEVLASNRFPKKGKDCVEILGARPEAPLAPKVASGAASCEIVVPGQFQFAMLMTRGCDVDKNRVLQLAPVYPIERLQSPAARDAVQANTATGASYLPPVPPDLGSFFEDSYVDLRYLTTVDRPYFESLKRVLSISRDALLDICLGWVRHVSGRDFPESIDCPSCSSPLAAFEHWGPALYPDVDY